MSSIQRAAVLRVASAYRTASKAAILVISGAIPTDLQARERKRVWETKNVNGEVVNVDDTSKRTIQHWQDRWNIETRGRWAAKPSQTLPVGWRENLERLTTI